ncbi:MAG TPA: CoA transferase, partial [Tepidiformaceae bacterium]|nr:CoA transferase [Tepidiformaceae bacterium]
DDGERSLLFLYRNSGKRGITLDYTQPVGRDILLRLAATADVLYESFEPGYLASLGLGYGDLSAANPRLIVVSITPFGQDGPMAHWKTSPIVSFAMSGAMTMSGWPGKEPCDAPHPMAYDSAATYATVAVMMALWSRHTTDRGQHIDVSVQEAGIGGLYPWAVPTYSYGGMGPTIPALATRGGVVATLYECQDGYVRMTAVTDRHWLALITALGNPEELAAAEWQDAAFRAANADVVHELISQHTRLYGMEEFMTLAQSHGVPIAAVRPPSGFTRDPNTRIRGYWTEVDHPVAGAAEYPGMPLKMSRSTLPPLAPAPLLGQHNDEIYAGDLALTQPELARLRASGAI